MTDRTPIPHEAPRNGDDAAGTAPQRPGSSSRGGATRKAIPARVMVSVAIAQPRHIDGGLKCPRCSGSIMPDAPRVLEHMTPHALCVALGVDPDQPDNLRFVHKSCADEKTNGNAATCADGDTHKIAKSKRLEKAREAHRAVLAGEVVREPGKIKSRGFPKVHRPMRRPQP